MILVRTQRKARGKRTSKGQRAVRGLPVPEEDGWGLGCISGEPRLTPRWVPARRDKASATCPKAGPMIVT